MSETNSPTTKRDPLLTVKTRLCVWILLVSSLVLWQLANPWFPMAMRLMCLSMILLGMIRWTSALLLVLVQLDLFVRAVDGRSAQNSMELLLAGGTVVLLMLISRLSTAQEFTRSTGLLVLLRAALRSLTESTGREVSPDDPAETSSHDLRWLGVQVAILVSAAGLLLTWFPEKDWSVQQFGLTAPGLRAIAIGLTLGIVYLLTAVPLGEWAWRRVSSDRAALYLRSQLLSWLSRDLRAVERRRRRLQRQQQRAVRRAQRRSHKTFRMTSSSDPS